MKNRRRNRLRYRHFLLLWLGQFASNFGTALTSFAVGVWVYQQTGSTTKLSFTLFSATLPAVLSAPLIGSLIDRYDRRQVLLLSNLGAFAGIGVLTLLFSVKEPGLVVICLMLAVVAVFRTAQWTTFSALIAYLVPVERLGKANGLVELGRSLSQIGAPILAGFMLTRLDISKILAIDASTYLFAILIVWRLPFRDVVAKDRPLRKTLAGEVWEVFLIVSYEAIRQWCRKFGSEYARRLKRKEGRLGDYWYLDVDQDGDVIDNPRSISSR